MVAYKNTIVERLRGGDVIESERYEAAAEIEHLRRKAEKRIKREKMIFRRTVPDKFDGGRWTERVEEFEVVVLAIADGYAMVKRPYCMPFVAKAKDLMPNVNLRGDPPASSAERPSRKEGSTP